MKNQTKPLKRLSILAETHIPAPIPTTCPSEPVLYSDPGILVSSCTPNEVPSMP